MTEEADLVSLSCPNYRKLLTEGVCQLLESKNKADFVLSSCKGEQSVQVHQIILSIFCPQFIDYKEEKYDLSHELNVKELDLILEFIYRGQISVNRTLLIKLRSAAQEIGFKQLIDVIDQVKNQENSVNVSPKHGKRMRSRTKKQILEFPDAEDMQKPENSLELDDGTVTKKNGEDEKAKEPYKCLKCDYITNRKDSYRNHLDVHDDEREFVCEICTRRFRNRRRYLVHVRGHNHPERMLKCEHCEYTTHTKTTLTQHLASRHHVDADGNELAADVKCSECDFVCVSKFQLRNHRIYKHSNRKFKCTECDFSAVRKTLVEKHIKMKHKNERPFMCDTCGFRSKTISAFHSHLMVHSNSKPFKCDSCAKAYKHNYQLRAHQRSHIGDGKPFLCHICCMAFRRNYEMQVHIKQKHSCNNKIDDEEVDEESTTQVKREKMDDDVDDEIVEMVIESF